MIKTKYKVPKTILEVRAVKAKLSREMEKLGMEAFREKYRKKTEAFIATVEKARQEKLAGKH
jgi:hypothetical protein